MTLTLSVLRCPDRVAPETRVVRGGDYVIGRGSDTDWPLTDPDRVLSKRHCTLEFRAGGWQVRDTSSNGTYLNRDAEPIGSGVARELRDGDRLRLGGYEIELRVEEEAFAPARAAPPRNTFNDDDIFAPAPPRDPFGEKPIPLSPRDDISIGLGGPSAGQLIPDDFDFGLDAFGQSAPTQSDHAPAGEQAFIPPRPAPPVLPDDDDWLMPVAPKTPTAATPSPFDEPSDPPPRTTPPPPTPAPPPQLADATDDLMAAFLRGAAIDAQPKDAVATMTALGAAFRALVSGIRMVLIARASIKSEFRIEQTMVRARGNNPLKFSADDDDALMALLGAGRRTEMAADAAVADALRDVRLHELASMAAMQQAVRALLARLDPTPLRNEAERSGGVLPAQRRARAFEAFEKLHGEITRALADDFDSVFGKAFARAYEQALAEAAHKEMS